MSAKMTTLGSREEWLKARKGYIGGSDASSIVGKNPYMTNVELWERKKGISEGADISDNPLVRYGHDAEEHLRELFKLDFPEYELGYAENNLWTNDKYPFAHGSLDGWLKDKDGRFGVLEIKTTSILQSMQREKWNRRIPDNYYCQVLWYMAVTEAQFACLKAQLKCDYDGDIVLTTRHYWLEREEVQDDIDYLMEAGAKFAECIQNDVRPALVLPAVI